MDRLPDEDTGGQFSRKFLPESVAEAYDRELARQKHRHTVNDDMQAFRVWGRRMMYEALNDLRRLAQQDNDPHHYVTRPALALYHFLTPWVLAFPVGAIMGCVWLVRFIRRTPEAPAVRLAPVLLYWSGVYDLGDMWDSENEEHPF